MKRGYAISISLVLLFIITRLIILTTSLDLYDFDELDLGMLAMEALKGKTIPYLALFMQNMSHHGGFLVNGIFAAGLYKLFGESGTTLKLCWMFFSLATFMTFFSIVKKYFSYRICIMASCFFIFSVPFFSWYSLMETATESTSLLFIMVITFLSLKMLPFRNNKIWDYLGYGFMGGIAVSFSHYCLFILFVSVLYQLWFNWKFFFKKPVFILLFSFLAGLSPWIYLNMKNNLEWFYYISLHLQNSRSVWSKFTDLIIDIFPRSLSFRDIFFIKGITLGYLYYFLCLALLLIVIISSRRLSFQGLKKYCRDSRNKNSFIYLFIVVFILVYTFSGFRIVGQLQKEYRYLLMLYPFIIITNAIFVDKLISKSGGLKTLGIIFFILFCVLGLSGNLSLLEMTNSNFKKPSIYRTHAFIWLNHRVYLYTRGDKAALESCIDSIQTNYKPYPRLGIYKKIKLGFISNPRSFFIRCKILGEYQDLFYEGLGISIGRFFQYEPVFQTELIRGLHAKYRLGRDGILSAAVVSYFLDHPDYLEEISKKLSVKTKNFYYEKVGLSIGILLYEQFGQIFDFLSKFDTKFAKSLSKGLGTGLAISNIMDNGIEMGERVNDEYKESYFEGIGFSLGLKAVPDLEKIMKTGDEIETKYRDYYYKGIGRAVGWHFDNDPTLILKLVGTKNLDFKINEYTFLTLGLYHNLDAVYKKMYCRGLGYGVAPYLSGYYIAIDLDKLDTLITSDDYFSLLKGVCYYYYEKASGLNSCQRVNHDKLAQRFQEIYREYFIVSEFQRFRFNDQG